MENLISDVIKRHIGKVEVAAREMLTAIDVDGIDTDHIPEECREEIASISEQLEGLLFKWRVELIERKATEHHNDPWKEFRHRQCERL